MCWDYLGVSARFPLGCTSLLPRANEWTARYLFSPSALPKWHWNIPRGWVMLHTRHTPIVPRRRRCPFGQRLHSEPRLGLHSEAIKSWCVPDTSNAISLAASAARCRRMHFRLAHWKCFADKGRTSSPANRATLHWFLSFLANCIGIKILCF
jgi:hypothetical protein